MKHLLPFYFLGWAASLTAQPYTASKDTVLMGSAFSFTAVHETKAGAWDAVNAGIDEVVRIENLISTWIPGTEASRINDNAGLKPVKVSSEVYRLIERSLKISELSGGYFDISFASIEKVWKFDGSQTTIPGDEAIAESVAKIGYQNIILNEADRTVFLKLPGMRIGFGAIGKGYAADKAKQVMLALGAKSGVVNAGGDLLAWGKQTDGKVWTIGIADPSKRGSIMSSLEITDKAVVTSGNYEKFIEIDGKRYCHIINPKTGWPVSGLKSVTIITDHAEIADALATTVFVMGREEGLTLVNTLKGVECIIVDDAGGVFLSDGMELGR